MITIEPMPVEGIVVEERMRHIDHNKVSELISSIKAIGLRTPITVRVLPELMGADGILCHWVPVLICGRHRLEAARALGWEDIPAIVSDGTETDARLWEIAENLHRADLTVLERSQHVAEWIRLTEEVNKGATCADIPKGRGQPKGGINAAARDLGIDRTEAQRAVKIDALPDEVKEAAKHAGIDDNQAALLKVASEPSPAAQLDAAKRNFRQGTGENEWYTPEKYIEAAREVMGGIDLDPASHPAAQQTVRADRFYTRQDDGLSKEWHGSVWLNPPYAPPLIGQFVEKLIGEIASGRATDAIMLTHNYTDTAWFHLAASASSAVCFTRGRIGFLDPTGQKAAPTQGQAFFYLGGDVDTFVRGFSQFGLIMTRAVLA